MGGGRKGVNAEAGGPERKGSTELSSQEPTGGAGSDSIS
jgi:hypothetical protein